MGVAQALVAVVVLIVVAWAVRGALAGRPQTKPGLCVPAIANVLLPAGQPSATIACCEGPDGECLGGHSSAYGAVVLVPTTTSPSCPVQVLRPDQYSAALPSPLGNAPVAVDMARLKGLYTAGTGCGGIQAAVTRLCFPASGASGSSGPAACSGGIAVARGAVSRTVACPGGRVQPTRRALVPSNFSLATCQAACCYSDLALGGPVASATVNATADAGGASPCAGHALDELLFYQCVAAPAPAT